MMAEPNSKLVTAFRETLGDRSRQQTSPCFEAFYREHLLPIRGQRVRGSVLAHRYARWAREARGQYVSRRQIRAFMEDAGHRYVRNNGTWYADVTFAVDLPELADTAPYRPMLVDELAPVLICRIDAIVSEMLAIRAKLSA